MMKKMGKISKFICSYPRLILVISAALIFFSAVQIPKLNLDLSLSQRFVSSYESISDYKNFIQKFGNEAPIYVVVDIKEGRIWDLPNFKAIEKLSKKLSEIDGVSKVQSVANIPGINIEPHRLAKLPVVRKLMINSRGNLSLITIDVDPALLSPRNGKELVERVDEVLNALPSNNLSFFVAGPLALQTAAIKYSRRDLFIISGVVLILIILILGFTLRSVLGVIGPLLVAGVTVTVTLGILATLGYGLSQFALIAIPVLVGLGVLDSVHIIHAYYERSKDFVAQTLSYENLTRRVLSKELYPCFWTSLTTLIGALALLFSPIEQLKSIALVIAIGVPISFIFSFTVLPAFISLVFRHESISFKRFSDPFALIAKQLANFAVTHRRFIIWTSIIVATISSIGLYNLKFSLDFPHIFKDSLEVQQQQEFLDREFGGSSSFEIVLTSNRSEDFLDIEMIKRVASLSQALRLSANVATTVSFIDLGVSKALAGRRELGSLKFNKETVEKLVDEFRQEGADLLQKWLTPDFRSARIHLKMNTQKPELHEKTTAAMEYLRNSFKDWFDVTPTGFALLYKSMEQVIMESFVNTFAFALVGICISIFLVAKCVRLGLISVLANLIPIVVVLGLMGWLGIGITAGVVVLPAVGLGLIADDTIHFIVALSRAKEKGRGGVESAFRSSGWPILMTQLILLGVFISLCASYFSSNIILGVFMSILLVVGLFFDLLFVPAVYMIFNQRDVRDKRDVREREKRHLHSKVKHGEVKPFYS